MNRTFVPEPTRQSQRMAALDVLRGVALCGILLVHIHTMGKTWQREWPELPARLIDPDWQVYLLNELFLEGTMRGLFTLLFGAGLLLMTRNAMTPDAPIRNADIYLRRNLALIVLGVANAAILLWPGDILLFYGISGLILFCFRMAGSRTLLAIGLALLVGVTAPQTVLAWGQAHHVHKGDAALELQAQGVTLNADQQHAVEERQAALTLHEPTPDQLAKETSQRRGGWVSATVWSLESWSGQAFGMPGVVMVCQSLAYMMIGMALFRFGILTGQKSVNFYVGLALAGYVPGLILRGWRLWALWHCSFSPTVWEPTLVYELGRLPMTLGHLGLIMALWRSNPVGGLARAFAALGQMALTNYLGHSLITSLLFYGLGLYGRYNDYELWVIAAGIWAVEALFSLWWLRRFQFGPVEWVLRCVSYGVRQPLRRVHGQTIASITV